MPHKAKLATGEKVMIVRGYVEGKLGMSEIKQNYGVHPQVLKDWIRLYKTRGVEGLIPATRHREYSCEIKYLAVQDYLNGVGSHDNICEKYDISDRRMLRNWILWYNSHGDFKTPKIGGANRVTKGRKTTLDERIEIVSHCISNKKDYGKAIEKYAVSYGQAYKWVKKYEENGIDGLIDRRGKRKDESSMNEVEKLRAQIKLKEAENLRLQMENELLKKLEALERGQNID